MTDLLNLREISLVIIPFKDEGLSLLVANVAAAASHPSVDEVWAIAPDEAGGRRLGQALDHPLARIMVQERIGDRRPGKGDAMNTGLRRAAAEGWDRVHFYDADITNFGPEWIDGAERAADAGYEVVRHRFPRAATDAMITWMVTRPALAMIFPGTVLPRLGQPLGGEVLLTRPALEGMASDQLVRSRSDWGIDTVITYAGATLGSGLYEHLVADGKRHALYGSLAELRTMMLECLDAAVSLMGRPAPPPGVRHGADPDSPVPQDLKQVRGYDVTRTIDLLRAEWAPGERDLASRLPPPLDLLLLEDRLAPDTLDADLWGEALRFLLAGFRLGDPAWEGLAFRLWVARVLGYTLVEAWRGYDHAMSYLEETIRQYETASDHA